MIPSELDPRRIQPPVGMLGEYDQEAILNSLKSLTIEDVETGSLAAYAEEDCERFMQTVHLLPQNADTVLEIGANPYFLTVLANWFRSDLKFTLTNYFGGNKSKGSDEIYITHPGGEQYATRFEFDAVNIEADRLPYAESSFDSVLFCEVIEHLTNDPQKAIHEISRVLRMGGSLILTTPNVARLENVARMMSGWNIYDPYSGFGPTGRHNREYTKHELHRLLTHCGFEADVMFTADVHMNRAADYYPDIAQIAPLIANRVGDLGQYHFSRWTKIGEPNQLKQSWLYRSYSPSELDEKPL